MASYYPLTTGELVTVKTDNTLVTLDNALASINTNINNAQETADNKAHIESFSDLEEMYASDISIGDFAIVNGNLYQRTGLGIDFDHITISNLATGTSNSWVSGSAGDYSLTIGTKSDDWIEDHMYYVRAKIKVSSAISSMAIYHHAPNGSAGIWKTSLSADTEYTFSRVFTESSSYAHTYKTVNAYNMNSDRTGIVVQGKECIIIDLSEYDELLTALANKSITTTDQICEWLDTYLPYIEDGETWTIGGSASNLLTNSFSGNVIDNSDGSYTVASSNTSAGYRYQSLASNTTDYFFGSGVIRIDDGSGKIGIRIGGNTNYTTATVGVALRVYNLNKKSSGSGITYFEFDRSQNSDVVTHWETGLHGYDIDENSPFAINVTQSGWMAYLSLSLNDTSITNMSSWINNNISPFSGTITMPLVNWQLLISPTYTKITDISGLSSLLGDLSTSTVTDEEIEGLL